MAQNVAILATNLQGHNQANVVIDPTTGASIEYRHLIKFTPTVSLVRCVSAFCGLISVTITP